MDLTKKKKTLRLISNGMYIVTSRAENMYGGATISWVTQASFKPPLIAAAIRPESNVFKCLSQSRRAIVHVLAADQHEIARRFLARTEVKESTMNGEPFTEGIAGLPILTRISSYLQCQVRQIINHAGDHALVLMEVLDAGFSGEIKPLLVDDSPWKYGG